MALRTAEMIQASFVYGEATALDAAFFVADRPYKVVAITARPLVVGSDGSAVTAQIRKVPDATAAASGTLVHSGTIDLKGTINTNQAITVLTTSAARIAAGEALALDVTGTTTAARGVITVSMLAV